ncbi:MAG TPA: hypothetical protein VL738_25780 [Dactylosporangium sp.]|nr:hypothetical protein [Dactylosporangium sp.]
MRSDLPELLRQARTAVPPPRFDIDDAVAAGRRLRVRRRAGWAGSTGAATLALGLAATVLAPHLGRSPGPAAGSASPRTPQFAFPADPLAGNIQAADFGGTLRMSGTVLVAPTFQAALVTRPDLPGVRTEDDGTRHEYGIAAAVVVVYRPGAFDAAAFTGGEPVSVDGRPGRYITSYQLGPGRRGPAVAWQYADYAWAVVAATDQRPALSLEQLLSLAVALRPGEPRVPSLAFRLGTVPAGFTVRAAGTADPGLTVSLPGESFLSLINPGGQEIALTLHPSWWGERHGTAGEASCPQQGFCYTTSPDGKWQVEADGHQEAGDDELLAMLRSITFADPANPYTWFPLNTAVPSA